MSKDEERERERERYEETDRQTIKTTQREGQKILSIIHLDKEENQPTFTNHRIILYGRT